MMRVPEVVMPKNQEEAHQAVEDEGQQRVNKESSRDARLKAIRHVSFLKQHRDTFVAYKWLIQALLRRTQGVHGGCQVQIADVVLFTDGEPSTWIYTNKFGHIDSRKFVATGEDSMWPRYQKTARRTAGVSKDDL
jgi:hypothetical protein